MPGHPADPEVWRGAIPAGDDLPEDWEPTGVPLGTFPRREPLVVHHWPRPDPVVVRAPRRRRLRDLAGAVVLGVATLFVPKARIDDHWSASPKIDLHEDAASEASGPPRPRRRP